MDYLKKIKQLLAGILAITFFTTNTLTPAPMGYAQSVELPHPSKGVAIPAEWGRVTDLVTAPQPSSILIHIQEPHANYAAQKNIKKILQHLNKNYGIKLILVEGAGNKLHPELFNFFSNDQELNQAVTDGLLKHGELTGAETFLVDALDRKAEGYGIENAEAYIKDRAAFQKVFEGRKLADTFLGGLYRQWQKQASLHLNKDLREFLIRYVSFEEERIPLPDWLETLKIMSKKHLPLSSSHNSPLLQRGARGDLTNPPLSPFAKGGDNAEPLDLTNVDSQREWPVLVRYFRLKEIDAQIDQTKVLEERQAFLKEAAAYLFKESRPKGSAVKDNASVMTPEALLKEVEALLAIGANEDLPVYQTRFIFENLLDLLPLDYSFDAYPNLRLYIQQLILLSELQSDRLQKEIKQLTKLIVDALVQEKDETQYVALLREYLLVKKLLHLELSREEFEQVKSRDLSPETFIKSLHLKVSNLSKISSLFGTAIHFYSSAINRENWMMYNAINRMRERKQSRAVLITGGFHTNGIKQKAIQSKSSYVQITPAAEKKRPEDERNYLRTLLGASSRKSPIAPTYISWADASRSEIGSPATSDVPFIAALPDGDAMLANHRSEMREIGRQVIASKRPTQFEKLFPDYEAKLAAIFKQADTANRRFLRRAAEDQAKLNHTEFFAPHSTATRSEMRSTFKLKQFMQKKFEPAARGQETGQLRVMIEGLTREQYEEVVKDLRNKEMNTSSQVEWIVTAKSSLTAFTPLADDSEEGESEPAVEAAPRIFSSSKTKKSLKPLARAVADDSLETSSETAVAAEKTQDAFTAKMLQSVNDWKGEVTDDAEKLFLTELSDSGKKAVVEQMEQIVQKAVTSGWLGKNGSYYVLMVKKISTADPSLAVLTGPRSNGKLQSFDINLTSRDVARSEVRPEPVADYSRLSGMDLVDHQVEAGLSKLQGKVRSRTLNKARSFWHRFVRHLKRKHDASWENLSFDTVRNELLGFYFRVGLWGKIRPLLVMGVISLALWQFWPYVMKLPLWALCALPFWAVPVMVWYFLTIYNDLHALNLIQKEFLSAKHSIASSTRLEEDTQRSEVRDFEKMVAISEEVDAALGIGSIEISEETAERHFDEQRFKTLDEIGDVFSVYFALVSDLEGFSRVEDFKRTQIYQTVRDKKGPVTAEEYKTFWEAALNAVTDDDVQAVKAKIPAALLPQSPERQAELEAWLRFYLAHFHLITLRRTDDGFQELSYTPYQRRLLLIKTEKEEKETAAAKGKDVVSQHVQRQPESEELVEALKEEGMDLDLDFLDHALDLTEETQYTTYLNQEDIDRTLSVLVNLAQKKANNPEISVLELFQSAFRKRLALYYVNAVRGDLNAKDDTKPLKQYWAIQIFGPRSEIRSKEYETLTPQTNIVPVITPLHLNGQLDSEGIRNLVDYLADQGVKAILVMGQTGEFDRLSNHHRLEAIRLFSKHAARKGMLVFANVTGNTEEQTLKNIKEAQNFRGVDVLVLCPLFYLNKPEKIPDHFSRIKTHKPLAVYNNPGMTRAVDIPGWVLSQLAARIILVKNSGPFFMTEEYIRYGLKVYEGDEFEIEDSLISGAQGSVSSLGNLFDWPRKLVETGLVDPDAGRFQTRIKEAVSQLTAGRTKTIAGLKEALRSLNVISSSHVAHGTPVMTPAERRDVAKYLKAVGVSLASTNGRRPTKKTSRSEVRLDPPLKRNPLVEAEWAKPEDILFHHEVALEVATYPEGADVADGQGSFIRIVQGDRVHNYYYIAGREKPKVFRATADRIGIVPGAPESFSGQLAERKEAIKVFNLFKFLKGDFWKKNPPQDWVRAQIKAGRETIPLNHYGIALDYTKNFVYVQINEKSFFRIPRNDPSNTHMLIGPPRYPMVAWVESFNAEGREGDLLTLARTLQIRRMVALVLNDLGVDIQINDFDPQFKVALQEIPQAPRSEMRVYPGLRKGLDRLKIEEGIRSYSLADGFQTHLAQLLKANDINAIGLPVDEQELNKKRLFVSVFKSIISKLAKFFKLHEKSWARHFSWLLDVNTYQFRWFYPKDFLNHYSEKDADAVSRFISRYLKERDKHKDVKRYHLKTASYHANVPTEGIERSGKMLIIIPGPESMRSEVRNNGTNEFSFQLNGQTVREVTKDPNYLAATEPEIGTFQHRGYRAFLIEQDEVKVPGLIDALIQWADLFRGFPELKKYSGVNLDLIRHAKQFLFWVTPQGTLSAFREDIATPFVAERNIGLLTDTHYFRNSGHFIKNGLNSEDSYRVAAALQNRPVAVQIDDQTIHFLIPKARSEMRGFYWKEEPFLTRLGRRMMTSEKAWDMTQILAALGPGLGLEIVTFAFEKSDGSELFIFKTDQLGEINTLGRFFKEAEELFKEFYAPSSLVDVFLSNYSDRTTSVFMRPARLTENVIGIALKVPVSGEHAFKLTEILEYNAVTLSDAGIGVGDELEHVIIQRGEETFDEPATLFDPANILVLPGDNVAAFFKAVPIFDETEQDFPAGWTINRSETRNDADVKEKKSEDQLPTLELQTPRQSFDRFVVDVPENFPLETWKSWMVKLDNVEVQQNPAIIGYDILLGGHHVGFVSFQLRKIEKGGSIYFYANGPAVSITGFPDEFYPPSVFPKAPRGKEARRKYFEAQKRLREEERRQYIATSGDKEHLMELIRAYLLDHYRLDPKVVERDTAKASPQGASRLRRRRSELRIHIPDPSERSLQELHSSETSVVLEFGQNSDGSSRSEVRAEFGSEEEFAAFHDFFASPETEKKRKYAKAMRFLADVFEDAAEVDAEKALATFKWRYLPYLITNIPPMFAEQLREILLTSATEMGISGLKQAAYLIATPDQLKLEKQLRSKSKKERQQAVADLAELIDQDDIYLSPLSKENNVHVHSKYSYSPYYPEEIAYRLIRGGLRNGGIIDHDTTAGNQDFRKAARILGLKITTGFEMRLSLTGAISKGVDLSKLVLNAPGIPNMIYFLCHALPDPNHPLIQKLLRRVRTAKIERNKEMINKVNAKLQELGIPVAVDYDKHVAVLAEKAEGEGELANTTDRHLMVGLAYQLGANEEYYRTILEDEAKVAAVMKAVEAGDVNVPMDALRSALLKPSATLSCFIAPNADETPTMEEVVPIIKAAGGIPIYPYLGDSENLGTQEEDHLREIFEYLVSIGVPGIAIMPHRNDPAEIERVVALAEEYGLRVFSGVDINKEDMPFIELKGRVEPLEGLPSDFWIKHNAKVGQSFLKGGDFLVGHEFIATLTMSSEQSAWIGYYSAEFAEMLPEEEDRFDFLASIGAKPFEQLMATERVLNRTRNKTAIVQILINQWRKNQSSRSAPTSSKSALLREDLDGPSRSETRSSQEPLSDEALNQFAKVVAKAYGFSEQEVYKVRGVIFNYLKDTITLEDTARYMSVLKLNATNEAFVEIILAVAKAVAEHRLDVRAVPPIVRGIQNSIPAQDIIQTLSRYQSFTYDDGRKPEPEELQAVINDARKLLSQRSEMRLLSTSAFTLLGLMGVAGIIVAGTVDYLRYGPEKRKMAALLKEEGLDPREFRFSKMKELFKKIRDHAEDGYIYHISSSNVVTKVDDRGQEYKIVTSVGFYSKYIKTKPSDSSKRSEMRSSSQDSINRSKVQASKKALEKMTHIDDEGQWPNLPKNDIEKFRRKYKRLTDEDKQELVRRATQALRSPFYYEDPQQRGNASGILTRLAIAFKHQKPTSAQLKAVEGLLLEYASNEKKIYHIADNLEALNVLKVLGPMVFEKAFLFLIEFEKRYAGDSIGSKVHMRRAMGNLYQEHKDFFVPRLLTELKKKNSPFSHKDLAAVLDKVTPLNKEALLNLYGRRGEALAVEFDGLFSGQYPTFSEFVESPFLGVSLKASEAKRIKAVLDAVQNLTTNEIDLPSFHELIRRWSFEWALAWALLVETNRSTNQEFHKEMFGMLLSDKVISGNGKGSFGKLLQEVVKQNDPDLTQSVFSFLVIDDEKFSNKRVQFLEFVAANPEISADLLPYLVSAFRLSSPNIPEESYIQTTLKKILYGASNTRYFLVRKLVEAVPYAGPIAQANELRDLAAKLDGSHGREDGILRYIRLKIHRAPSPGDRGMVEALLLAIDQNDRERLRGFITPEFHHQVFMDFDKQLIAEWNGIAKGVRETLEHKGSLLELVNLSSEELSRAIALSGKSQILHEIAAFLDFLSSNGINSPDLEQLRDLLRHGTFTLAQLRDALNISNFYFDKITKARHSLEENPHSFAGDIYTDAEKVFMRRLASGGGAVLLQSFTQLLTSINDSAVTGRLREKENFLSIVELYRELQKRYPKPGDHNQENFQELLPEAVAQLPGVERRFSGNGELYPALLIINQEIKKLKQVEAEPWAETEMETPGYAEQHAAEDAMGFGLIGYHRHYSEAKLNAFLQLRFLHYLAMTLFEKYTSDLEEEFFEGDASKGKVKPAVVSSMTGEKIREIAHTLAAFLDLLRVSGIGPYELEQLRNLLQYETLTLAQLKDVLVEVQSAVMQMYDRINFSFGQITRAIAQNFGKEKLEAAYKPANERKLRNDDDYYAAVEETFIGQLASEEGISLLERFAQAFSSLVQASSEMSLVRVLKNEKKWRSPSILEFFPGVQLQQPVLTSKFGNKFSTLAEMAANDFPVPPGFVLNTDYAQAIVGLDKEDPAYPEFRRTILESVLRLENRTGQLFPFRMLQMTPDEQNIILEAREKWTQDLSEEPLIVSVRSGSFVPLPGVMSTFLNLPGTNNVVQGLTRAGVSLRTAYDDRRRYLESFGHTIFGFHEDYFAQRIEAAKFGAKGKTVPIKEFTEEQMRLLVRDFELKIEKVIHGLHTIADLTLGEDFPHEYFLSLIDNIGRAIHVSWLFGATRRDIETMTPEETKEVIRGFQEKFAMLPKHYDADEFEILLGGLQQVARSWQAIRTQSYLEGNDVSKDWGTPVGIQAMISGNRSQDSGAFVANTHDLASGIVFLNGHFKAMGEGEELVSGRTRYAQVLSRNEKGIFKTSLESTNPNLYEDVRELLKREADFFGGPSQSEGSVAFGETFVLQRIPIGLVPSTSWLEPGYPGELVAKGKGATGSARWVRFVFDEEDFSSLEEKIKKLRAQMNQAGEKNVGIAILGQYMTPDEGQKLSLPHVEGMVTSAIGGSAHATIAARKRGKTLIGGTPNFEKRPAQGWLLNEETLFEGMEGKIYSIDGNLKGAMAGHIYIGKIPIERLDPEETKRSARSETRDVKPEDEKPSASERYESELTLADAFALIGAALVIAGMVALVVKFFSDDGKEDFIDSIKTFHRNRVPQVEAMQKSTLQNLDDSARSELRKVMAWKVNAKKIGVEIDDRVFFATSSKQLIVDLRKHGIEATPKDERNIVVAGTREPFHWNDTTLLENALKKALRSEMRTPLAFATPGQFKKIPLQVQIWTERRGVGAIFDTKWNAGEPTIWVDFTARGTQEQIRLKTAALLDPVFYATEKDSKSPLPKKTRKVVAVSARKTNADYAASAKEALLKIKEEGLRSKGLLTMYVGDGWFTRIAKASLGRESGDENWKDIKMGVDQFWSAYNGREKSRFTFTNATGAERLILLTVLNGYASKVFYGSRRLRRSLSDDVANAIQTLNSKISGADADRGRLKSDVILEIIRKVRTPSEQIPSVKDWSKAGFSPIEIEEAILAAVPRVEKILKHEFKGFKINRIHPHNKEDMARLRSKVEATRSAPVPNEPARPRQNPDDSVRSEMRVEDAGLKQLSLDIWAALSDKDPQPKGIIVPDKPVFLPWDPDNPDGGVLLLKPSAGHFSQPTIYEILRRAREFGYYADSVRVYEGEWLKKHKVISNHYGRLYEVATKGFQALTPSDLHQLIALYKHHFGHDAQWDPSRVYGSLELMEKTGISPEKTAELWNREASRTEKLSDGVIALISQFPIEQGIPEELAGEKVVFLNNFMIQLIAAFEKSGAKTPAILLRGIPGEAVSWEDMREKFVGVTNPEDAVPGSIRYDAAEGILKISNPVTVTANVVHLSDEEGRVIEKEIWFPSRFGSDTLRSEVRAKGKTKNAHATWEDFETAFYAFLKTVVKGNKKNRVSLVIDVFSGPLSVGSIVVLKDGTYGSGRGEIMRFLKQYLVFGPRRAFELKRGKSPVMNKSAIFVNPVSLSAKRSKARSETRAPDIKKLLEDLQRLQPSHFGIGRLTEIKRALWQNDLAGAAKIAQAISHLKDPKEPLFNDVIDRTIALKSLTRSEVFEAAFYALLDEVAKERQEGDLDFGIDVFWVKQFRSGKTEPFFAGHISVLNEGEYKGVETILKDLKKLLALKPGETFELVRRKTFFIESISTRGGSISVRSKEEAPRSEVRTQAERYAEALETLQAHDQADVLRFWDELTTNQRTALLEQIERLDWAEVAQLKYDLIDHPKPKTLDLSTAEPVQLATANDPADRKAGEELLSWGAKQGKAAFAIILTAGGSGSRFREFFQKAKGLFKGLPLTEDTLFESSINKYKALAKRYGHDTIFPLIIMTSDVTHEETAAYFEANDWFGMKDRIQIVKQRVLPVIEKTTGKALMEEKWKIALQGGGHGDAFDDLLLRDDVNAWLEGFGVRSVLYSNIDNPLYPLDVNWFGAHVRFVEKVKQGLIQIPEGFAIMSEGLIRKKDRLKDKLSELLRVNGVRMPVHYSKASPDLRAQTTRGTPSYRMIELPLEGTLPIAFSVVSKSWTDWSGEQREVWKFERNSDDKMSDGANYPFENEDTFASIKEPPGKNESPDTSRALQTQHWKVRLEAAGYTVDEGFLIQLPWAVDFMSPEALRQKLEEKNFPNDLTPVWHERTVYGYLVNDDWSWGVIPQVEEGVVRSEMRPETDPTGTAGQRGVPGTSKHLETGRSETREEFGEWEQRISSRRPKLTQGSPFQEERFLRVESQPGIDAFLGHPASNSRDRFLVIENRSNELREGLIHIDLRLVPEIRNAYLKREPHLQPASFEDALNDFWLWDPFDNKGKGKGPDFYVGKNIRVVSVQDNTAVIYFKLAAGKHHYWALNSAEVLDHFHEAWRVRDRQYEEKVDETLVMSPVNPHSAFRNEEVFTLFEKIPKAPHTPSQLYRATIQGDPSGRIYIVKKFFDERRQEQEEEAIEQLMTVLGNRHEPKNRLNDILEEKGVQAHIYSPLLFNAVRAFKTSTGEEKVLWAGSESLTVVYPYVEGLDWGLHLQQIQDLPEGEYLLHVLNIMVRATQGATVLKSQGLSRWDLHWGNLIVTPNEDLGFIDYQEMKFDLVTQLLTMFFQALELKGLATKASDGTIMFHFAQASRARDLIKDVLSTDYSEHSNALNYLGVKLNFIHQIFSKKITQTPLLAQAKASTEGALRSEMRAALDLIAVNSAPIETTEEFFEFNQSIGGGSEQAVRAVTEKIMDGIIPLLAYGYKAKNLILAALIPAAQAAEPLAIASMPEDFYDNFTLRMLHRALGVKTVQTQDAFVLDPETAFKHGLAYVLRNVFENVPIVVLTKDPADLRFLETINVQLRQANRPPILPAADLDDATRKLLGIDKENGVRGSSLNLKGMVFAGAQNAQAMLLAEQLKDNLITIDQRMFANFLKLAGFSLSGLVEKMQAEYLALARSA